MDETRNERISRLCTERMEAIDSMRNEDNSWGEDYHASEYPKLRAIKRWTERNPAHAFCTAEVAAELIEIEDENIRSWK